MRAQGRRDTAPELKLRRAVHALGLRYRVDEPLPLAGLRRRADLLFTRAQVAVFVDGCYWHGCPDHGTQPKTNSEWWSAKITANKARDADTDARLVELGWSVLRVWEHEAAEAASERVAALVRAEACTDELGRDRAPQVTGCDPPSKVNERTRES